MPDKPVVPTPVETVRPPAGSSTDGQNDAKAPEGSSRDQTDSPELRR